MLRDDIIVNVEVLQDIGESVRSVSPDSLNAPNPVHAVRDRIAIDFHIGRVREQDPRPGPEGVPVGGETVVFNEIVPNGGMIADFLNDASSQVSRRVVIFIIDIVIVDISPESRPDIVMGIILPNRKVRRVGEFVSSGFPPPVVARIVIVIGFSLHCVAGRVHGKKKSNFDFTASAPHQRWCNAMCVIK